MTLYELTSLSLAQTWLINLMFCSKHIAHYRPSSLIRAYSARAGWHAKHEYKELIYEIL